MSLGDAIDAAIKEQVEVVVKEELGQFDFSEPIKEAIKDFDMSDAVNAGLDGFDWTDVDLGIDKVLNDFDFSDAIKDGLDNYDFQDDIEKAVEKELDDRDFSDDIEKALEGKNFDDSITDALENYNFAEVIGDAMERGRCRRIINGYVGDEVETQLTEYVASDEFRMELRQVVIDLALEFLSFKWLYRKVTAKAIVYKDTVVKFTKDQVGKVWNKAA